MKKIVLLILMLIGMGASTGATTSVKGETSRPVFKRMFTFE